MTQVHCSLKHEIVSKESFIDTTVDFIADQIERALLVRDVAFLGLSVRPELLPVYQTLATEESIRWDRVVIFAIDTPYALGGHRNAADQTLVDVLSGAAHIKRKNFLAPDQSLEFQQCAADYASLLENKLLVPDCCVLSDAGQFGEDIGASAFDEDVLAMALDHGEPCVSVSLSFLAHSRALLFALPSNKQQKLWNAALENAEGDHHIDRIRKHAVLSLMNRSRVMVVST